MKAIILAAGIGNRLGTLSENKPKSLLEFDGKSLLKRHIDILLANQINDLTIVTGYESEMIMRHLEDSDISINYIYNDRYTEGSIISLNCAQEILFSEPEFILMDADVLYDQEMIRRLVKTEINNCLLLDRNFIPGDEPVKICVNKDGLINEFRKKIAQKTLEFRGNSIKYTCSIGVSNILGENLDGMMVHADRLLYLAKQGGRNRVEGNPSGQKKKLTKASGFE